METLLLKNVWLDIGLWVSLYTLDYYLTLICSRLYESNTLKHYVFQGGYELNPFFQKDVASLRPWSPRFLLALAVSSTLLYLTYVYTRESPDLFTFLLGAFVLLEGAVQIRHLKNLIVFTYARKSQGLRGQIEYSRWLSLRIAVGDLSGFALLYGLCGLISGHLFFGGGAAACGLAALRFWIESLRANPALPPPSAA